MAPKKNLFKKILPKYKNNKSGQIFHFLFQSKYIKTHVTWNFFFLKIFLFLSLSLSCDLNQRAHAGAFPEKWRETGHGTLKEDTALITVYIYVTTKELIESAMPVWVSKRPYYALNFDGPSLWFSSHHHSSGHIKNSDQSLLGEHGSFSASRNRCLFTCFVAGFPVELVVSQSSLGL